MNIKTIAYQRVKNLGNYESERMEITAELNEDDDVDEAIALIKRKCFEHLNIETDNQNRKYDDNPF